MAGAFLKKILIVDDEEEALIHLGNILRRANYEIISATGGKEAVKLAKEQSPDLIILDIVMADLEGGEVAAILAEHPSTAEIPIIFLTGILTKNEDLLGKTSGKRHVLAKPAMPKDLLEMVSKLLNKDVD